MNLVLLFTFLCIFFSTFSCKKFATLSPATFDSFRTFEGVLQTSTFIDKTNLIKDFVSYTKPHAHFVACPRLFGKTVNLNMLRKFLHLNLNPNGSLVADKKQTKNFETFSNNLRIAENETFINEHFGEYVVISISLKEVLIHDYDTFLKSLYSQIRFQVYDEHLWLYNELDASKNVQVVGNAELREIRYDIVKKIYSADYDEEIIAESLISLAQILRRRFNRKVVLLVDEFDAPVVNAITHGVDVLKINSLIERMFCNLIKPPQKTVVEHILITGIHNTLVLSGSSLSSAVVHHEFSHNHVFAQYFGFSEIEVCKLLDDHLASDEEKKKAIEYYRGYTICGTTKQIFNPFTILNYIHSRRSNSIDNALQPYWVNSGVIQNFQNLLKVDKIREFIVKLVLHKKIDLSLKTASRCGRMVQFKKIITGDQRIELTELKLFFFYLLEVGYLTYTNKESIYRIPNTEVATYIRCQLRSHYDEYKVLNSVEIGEKFNLILQSETPFSTKTIAEYEKFFENQLKKFFSHNFDEFQKPDLNEFEIQAFVYTAAKLSGLNIVRGSYDVANVDPKSKSVKGRADIIIMNDYTEVILIIEIKHNKNVSIATDQVKLYRPLVYKPKILHLMGFNVDTNCKVKITITTIRYPKN